jgi:precorrin-6A/cobalt-precorrin-6A reductase
MHRSVLVLGGTAEGRELATRLTEHPLRVVSSLAGRVSNPRRPAGEVRIGGFGGPEGLAAYLREHRIAAVVDATHPFAARMSTNAAAACARTGTPLLILRRPAWEPADKDRWTRAPDLEQAALAVQDLTGPEGRVLLTTGRQGVAAFAAAPQRFWLRAVEPPAGPRPARCALILDRGPFTVDGESRLLRHLAVDVVVTKNSGGPLTVAKLAAARDLGLPVVIVDRPPLPPGVEAVPDVEAAVDWTGRFRRAEPPSPRVIPRDESEARRRARGGPAARPGRGSGRALPDAELDPPVLVLVPLVREVGQPEPAAQRHRLARGVADGDHQPEPVLAEHLDAVVEGEEQRP